MPLSSLCRQAATRARAAFLGDAAVEGDASSSSPSEERSSLAPSSCTKDPTSATVFAIGTRHRGVRLFFFLFSSYGDIRCRRRSSRNCVFGRIERALGGLLQVLSPLSNREQGLRHPYPSIGCKLAFRFTPSPTRSFPLPDLKSYDVDIKRAAALAARE